MKQVHARLRRALATQASHRWEHPHVDERWKRRAACRGEDPALWFPTNVGRRGSKAARALESTGRAICAHCPVAGDCLAFAIALDLRYGTYGGLDELSRAELTGKRPE